jgi:hypothetical protein
MFVAQVLSGFAILVVHPHAFLSGVQSLSLGSRGENAMRSSRLPFRSVPV